MFEFEACEVLKTKEFTIVNGILSKMQGKRIEHG